MNLFLNIDVITSIGIITLKKLTMKRKDFLKKALLGSALATTGLTAKASDEQPSEISKPKNNVGMNHLPNVEEKTATTVLHRADSRGMANHGWLQSRHSFSFANYYNPERMNFGVLRVLNDDIVAGGRGFGTHPHNNMEIISIPLSGDLEHKDSMGNKAIIKSGDIQIMSAGTGIAHSEFNKNADQDVRFLQIWVMPCVRDVTPRYDQITLNKADRKNTLQQILSPNPEDDGVWAHQNAWFHLSDLDKGKTVEYHVKDAASNGVYVFVLNGEVTVNDQALYTRDGFGLWDTETLSITADSDTEILLMEVPMELA